MKKITNLLIGTNNKGKLREIRALLPKYIKIYSTSDFNLKSPIVSGKTFEDNSVIKSKYYSKKTKLPCLSDDSGLEIDILDKAPGIYSARWGGKYSDFNKAIERVYRELKKKDKNWINKKIKDGFGYDPIFIPTGKNFTFGEISSYEKYKSDHRFKAFKKIKKFL